MRATLTHDFTIDELRAYAAGALAPARAAVIAAHLDAGCLECHSWLLNADEIGALLGSGALPAPGARPAATWDERLRGWARRRVRPRRFTLLLVVLPFKIELARLILAPHRSRRTRLGAALTFGGLTMAVLRWAVTRPSWIAAEASAPHK